MKIKYGQTSAIIVAGLLGSSCIEPFVAAVNSSELTVNSQTLKDAINLARASFDAYKSTGDILNLEKSILEFGNIAEFIKEESEIKEDPKDEMYKLFLEQRDELYILAERMGSGQYIVDYAKSILKGWTKNRHMTKFSRVFLEEGLIDYNKDKLSDIQKDLDTISRYYYHVLSEEWENPDNIITLEEFIEIENNRVEIPEGDYYGPPPEYDTGYPPEPPAPEDNDEYPPGSEGMSSEEDFYSTTSNYQKEGSKCMLIKNIYKNNVLIETTKKEVPKEEYAYCGIYDYVLESAPPPKVELDEEYISSDQNVESNKYIYYTVTKDKVNPYYYNTGIRATLDERVSYTQLRDALYQIAIKAGGFSTDSNKESLTIIEGKPIVLRDEKEYYSKQEVEKMLDGFKSIDIKIQEYTDKTTSLNTDIEEYIKENSSIDFDIDDKKVSISSVKIEDSVVMIGLNDISELLELKVSKDKNSYVLKKGDTLMKFKLDDIYYRKEDNQQKHFLSKPRKINDTVYVDLKTVCEEMGYSINWDKEDLTFIITKVYEK